MRVDWAILCRYVEAGGGLATLVSAGVDTYFVPELPGPVSLILGVRVVASDEELAEPHQIAFRVLGPDLSEISRLEGEFRLETNPLKQPGWEGGGIFPSIQTFEATEYGAHSLEISIDGRELKSVPFGVREPPEAESLAP